MVVREVHSGHVAVAWGDRAGSNTTRAWLVGELANLLASRWVPDVAGGRGARLSRHNSLSIGANVDGQNVVSVEGLVRVAMLGAHLDLLATVELLVSRLRVHYDTEGCNHVDGLTLRRVIPAH